MLKSLKDMGEDLKFLQKELDESNREAEKYRKKAHNLELDQFELKT